MPERLTYAFVERAANLATRAARDAGMFLPSEELYVDDTGGSGRYRWNLVVDSWENDVNGTLLHHGRRRIGQAGTLADVEREISTVRELAFWMEYERDTLTMLDRAMSLIVDCQGLSLSPDRKWGGPARMSVLESAQEIRGEGVTGYTANMVGQDGKTRVWVERVGRADGAVCDRMVTIETYNADKGHWSASTWDPRTGKPVRGEQQPAGRYKGLL